MLKLRRGRVVSVEPAGAGGEAVGRARRRRGATGCDCLSALTGPVEPGDEVVVNVEAQDLGLGSGGFDIVYVNLTRGLSGEGGEGAHVMKLNYTPLQHAVVPIEEGLDELPRDLGAAGRGAGPARPAPAPRSRFAALRRAPGSASSRRRGARCRGSCRTRRGPARARPARRPRDGGALLRRHARGDHASRERCTPPPSAWTGTRVRRARARASSAPPPRSATAASRPCTMRTRRCRSAAPSRWCRAFRAATRASATAASAITPDRAGCCCAPVRVPVPTGIAAVGRRARLRELCAAVAARGVEVDVS